MSNLNRKMISTAIQSLLTRADSELEAVRAEPDCSSPSWTIHMTASLLCSIAVDVLMDVRKTMDDEERNNVEAKTETTS